MTHSPCRQGPPPVLRAVMRREYVGRVRDGSRLDELSVDSREVSPTRLKPEGQLASGRATWIAFIVIFLVLGVLYLARDSLT